MERQRGLPGVDCREPLGPQDPGPGMPVAFLSHPYPNANAHTKAPFASQFFDIEAPTGALPDRCRPGVKGGPGEGPTMAWAPSSCPGIRRGPAFAVWAGTAPGTSCMTSRSPSTATGRPSPLSPPGQGGAPAPPEATQLLAQALSSKRVARQPPENLWLLLVLCCEPHTGGWVASNASRREGRAELCPGQSPQSRTFCLLALRTLKMSQRFHGRSPTRPSPASHGSGCREPWGHTASGVSADRGRSCRLAGSSV